jgi:octanoyl-[GcvH]:protein N-octanoyltransferase
MTKPAQPVKRKPPLRLYDRSAQCVADDVLLPFAFEECIMREVAESGVPAVHLWRHGRAVVLGLRDRKLPQAVEAIRWLEGEGFRVGVRHSGGAAVPLDSGVLNVTLMMPKPPGQLDFHDDFVQMSDWIADVLRPGGLRVEVGEIRGSYCPGNFDLSIDGKKFCGIAQRRQVRAIAVQAFVNVEGSGEARGERIREYYRRALAGAANGGYAPDVRPDRVTSLAECAASSAAGAHSEPVRTVAQFVSRWKQVLRQRFEVIETECRPDLEHPDVREKARQIRARYDRS